MRCEVWVHKPALVLKFGAVYGLPKKLFGFQGNSGSDYDYWKRKETLHDLLRKISSNIRSFPVTGTCWTFVQLKGLDKATFLRYLRGTDQLERDLQPTNLRAFWSSQCTVLNENCKVQTIQSALLSRALVFSLSSVLQKGFGSLKWVGRQILVVHQRFRTYFPPVHFTNCANFRFFACESVFRWFSWLFPPELLRPLSCSWWWHGGTLQAIKILNNQEMAAFPSFPVALDRVIDKLLIQFTCYADWKQ